MSEVGLSIGGRKYNVACAEGEEAHVAKLGGLIDAKLQQLGGNPSPQEAQNMLFAALLLADELHEARETLAGARSERERAQADVETAQKDLAEAQRKLAPLEEERDSFKARLDPLENERNAAVSRLAEAEEAAASLKDEHERASKELAELKPRITRLEADREELADKLRQREVEPNAANAVSPLDDPDLAPSLERFADLLENCADKLESKTPNA